MLMNKLVRAIRIGIPALAVAMFCMWLRSRANPLFPGPVFALISICLFTLTLISALSRWAASVVEDHAILPETADTKRERFSAWAVLLGFGVAVSTFEFVLVYLLSNSSNDFLHSFSELYYRSDVAHYMGIAKDWYVPEGDERLRLVFLPLYSLAIRLLTWQGNYFQGAFIAAQLFSLLCLPAAYELFRLDMNRPAAMACARILYLLPGAAFLRVPMSEGLFLFLTLLAVYAARKRRFWLAGFLTALSAFTRSLGVLLLSLLFIEMVFAFADAWRKDRQASLHLIPKHVGCLLLGCVGTLLYLAINWQVSGSPFTFLIYQRENWTQERGLFFNTAAYQSEYALSYFRDLDWESVLSLSLPNMICCFGALGLLCADRKRMRVSYLLWALVYYAVSVGATWLLSGPRYLAMLFPLAPALKRYAQKPLHEAILELLLLLGQTVYLLMLALDMFVY
jgi:hypothetical protein